MSLSYALSYVSIFPSQGSDWILPSSKLTLKKMSATDEGQYTCMAQHPSVESLSRKRSVSITVLSGKKSLQMYLHKACCPLYRLRLVCHFPFLKTGFGFLCNWRGIQLSTFPKQKRIKCCVLVLSLSTNSNVTRSGVSAITSLGAEVEECHLCETFYAVNL